MPKSVPVKKKPKNPAESNSQRAVVVQSVPSEMPDVPQFDFEWAVQIFVGECVTWLELPETVSHSDCAAVLRRVATRLKKSVDDVVIQPIPDPTPDHHDFVVDYWITVYFANCVTVLEIPESMQRNECATVLLEAAKRLDEMKF